jgi:hypothetical protein
MSCVKCRLMKRSGTIERFPLALLIVCMLASAHGWAQVDTASLTGLVTDPSRAVVANAEVTARNTATNIEYSAATAESGFYRFASLPAGSYTITVAYRGFKKSVQENVGLQVGQKGRLDFTLEIGQITETAMVQAAGPMLANQEAAPGTVIENRMITDLPLAGRNWDDLIAMVPGTQADRYTEESGGTPSGRTGAVSIHGVRSLQNNFMLDGTDNNSISENVQELTTQVVRPSVDSIQEFRVSTNPYAAENGRSPGALISVTTRSGSNAFHGTVYEFLRNRVFDANSFFNNRSGLEKPQNIQNQFGGNLGGPALKDRLFFFFNYEGTRIRKGVTRLGNVPMPNERIGDFSSAAAAANRLTYSKIYDRVGDCRAKMPSAFNSDGSFINNIIPAECLDPLAQKIMDLLPAANLTPSNGPLNISNFIRAPGIMDDTDSITSRVDWKPTSLDSVFVRYSNVDRYRYIPGIFGGILDGTYSSANGRLSMKSHSAAIGWTRALNAKMVNEFRIGWGRNNSSGTQDPFGLNTLREFGIRGVQDSPIYSGGISSTDISAKGGTQTIGGQSGFNRIGSSHFMPKFQKTNQFQWADTFSLSLDRHFLRFGADIRAPMRNIYLDIPALRGQLTFDGNRTGIGLADFLLGYPSQQQLTNLVQVDQRLEMYSFFFQDDWRVGSKLTVNLGIRWDFIGWPYEASDRMTNFDVTTGEVFTPKNSSFGRSLVKSDKNNLAPRAGIAYQITPKTVVRAGYGRFFTGFERNGSEDQLALNMPWLVNNVVTAASTNQTANNMRLATGFNLSLDPNEIMSDPNKVALVRIRAVDPNSVTSTVDQWNFGIQRALPGNIVLTLDYVGTKGTHLSTFVNLNQPYFNENGTVMNVLGADGKYSPLLPYPRLGPISYRQNNGNSTYHGMEISVERRYAKGLAFQGAYTFSKAIDESQEHLTALGSSVFTQNPRNVLKERRGPSDFDAKHRFVFSSIYELPFGSGRSYLTGGALSHILGGWRISGGGNLRSGLPFSVRASSNDTLLGGPRGGGLVNASANCLRDGSLAGKSSQTIDRWFDTSAYAIPTAPNPTKLDGSGKPVVEGCLGNCGRNTLRGPDYINFDFALGRSFNYFGEGRSLDFRWEMFNVFNTPQFGLPERNISSNSAGRITRLAGDSRLMQFGLRLIF